MSTNVNVMCRIDILIPLFSMEHVWVGKIITEIYLLFYLAGAGSSAGLRES